MKTSHPVLFTKDDQNAKPLSYVLVSPARNEQDFIGQTIESMINQTVRPLKWVIVSDGSTDRTDEIVQKYAEQHNWIELVRRPARTGRHFAGKVDAFNAGYERLEGLSYDLVGSMDADISFVSDYFEFLVAKFAECPKLGVGGTPFREKDSGYDYRFASTDHVSGACQLFRKECFEAIDGYTPLKGGGIDVVAVLSARMHGWETRTFVEKHYDHLRPQSSANYGTLRARFKDGEKDYMLGGHPLWELFRGIYQMSRSPWVVGGGALMIGYVWSAIRRRKKSMPDDLVEFRRRWQMDRLHRLVRGVPNTSSR